MAKKLQQMTKDELNAFYQEALKEYEECKAKGLKLDMSRGKPGRAQVSISDPDCPSRIAVIWKRLLRCFCKQDSGV